MNTVERAREIRKELKKEFPGVKFSVRSSRGGGSINIHWTDFPTEKAVKEITSKYESIRYDERTHEILCGGNTFVFRTNHWSDEMKEAIKENLIKKYGVEFYNEYINETYDYYRYANDIYNKMYEDSKNAEEVEAVEEIKVSEGVEIKLNEDKNGIEIYFTSKPSEEVRTALKSNGFRWSKYNKCWYAKKSGETIKFANSLIPVKEKVPEVVADVEEIIRHEIEYTNQVLKEELEEVEREIKPLEVQEAKTEIKINNVLVGRKENNILDIKEHGTEENIIITKYAILSNKDFDFMSNNLLNDFSFLEGHGGSRAEAKAGEEVPENYDINYIYNNRNKFNFYEINILITNEDQTKFIVVNPHGYSYCRYTGILTAAEGKRVLKQLKGEININKLEVIESNIKESQEVSSVEKCNKLYLDVEALENRLKLVKSDKLKYKLQDQINNKMKEIAKIILSDEILYLQFMKESKE